MTAWAKDQGVEGDDFIKLFGDPSGVFTLANDIEMVHPGPVGVGIKGRCKRHAMYVVDGEVKWMDIAENELDPAGDDFPERTLPEAVLEGIKKC
jgi:peroxiredoxin